MTLPKLILMLAYILFSAAVVLWEKKKLFQQKSGSQPTEGDSSLGNIILK